MFIKLFLPDPPEFVFDWKIFKIHWWNEENVAFRDAPKSKFVNNYKGLSMFETLI